MKDFYEKVIDKLMSEAAINQFTEKAVPAIKQVDLYRGQYLYENDFEQLTLPAVLVEYNLNIENNSATIGLHCVWEKIVYETDSRSAHRDKALMFFDWQDTIYDLVYNLESKNTGKLRLLTEGVPQDETPTMVHLFTFECSYMGRVKPAADKYNYAEGEEVVTTGKIKQFTQPDPDYNFEGV